MFCPVCKAEYRKAITTCPDCEVGLVPALPKIEDADQASMAKGALVPLWEGDDLALHTSLLEALDAAKIPYFSKPLSIYPGVRRADPFPVQPLVQFGYKVAVFSADFSAAKEILDELLDEEPKDAMELPEQPEAAVSGPEVAAGRDEQPILEIWRGADQEFFRFLQDALRENEIPTGAEAIGSENVVFVRPSDAPRTKEIIRELNEASPPQ